MMFGAKDIVLDDAVKTTKSSSTTVSRCRKVIISASGDVEESWKSKIMGTYKDTFYHIKTNGHGKCI